MRVEQEIPATSRTLDTHLSTSGKSCSCGRNTAMRLTSSYALGYRLELTSAQDDGQPAP